MLRLNFNTETTRSFLRSIAVLLQDLKQNRFFKQVFCTLGLCKYFSDYFHTNYCVHIKTCADFFSFYYLFRLRIRLQHLGKVNKLEKFLVDTRRSNSRYCRSFFQSHVCSIYGWKYLRTSNTYNINRANRYWKLKTVPIHTLYLSTYFLKGIILCTSQKRRGAYGKRKILSAPRRSCACVMGIRTYFYCFLKIIEKKKHNRSLRV